MKRRIPPLLIICLCLSLCSCAKPVTGADYPAVFVHGYSGWGSYDERDKSTPYWGLGSTNVKNSLTNRGYQVYMASVGPVSSAWDRACELYAQLTGTRVDYGAAHSARCGHERFGRDFSGDPLIPDFTWDASHKIHLIGHSFGGATIRLLLDLLADGDAARSQRLPRQATVRRPSISAMKAAASSHPKTAAMIRGWISSESMPIRRMQPTPPWQQRISMPTMTTP